VLGIEAVGEVTADDYESVMLPAVSAARQGGEKARLLYLLGPEFTG
jgi:hypothetical protein